MKALVFAIKGDGTEPREAYITLRASNGAAWRSRNIHEIFTMNTWREIRLVPSDFKVEPGLAAKKPELAEKMALGVDWGRIVRIDIHCVGPLMSDKSAGMFGSLYLER